MLRLDRTVTRKVPLHYDQDAEDSARWQAMFFTEKREVVLVLQQRTKMLRAWSEQERNKNAATPSDELAD